MRKIVMWVCIGLFLASGILVAGEKRVYNNGEIDFLPLDARIVLKSDDFSSTPLKEVQYSVDGSSIQVYKDPITFSEEGRHFIVYRSVDVVNNISKEKVYSFIIDGSAPELSGSAKGPAYIAGDTAYLTGKTAIILWGKDAYSGVQAIYVSLDDSDFMSYNEAMTIPEEGYHVGRAYIVDNVGNASDVYEIGGYVDNTPPVISIEKTKELVDLQGRKYTTYDNVFSVYADDLISGVKETFVSIDGKEFFTYTEPFKIEKPGFHSIRAKAVDFLGNESSIAELTFYSDAKTPAVSHEVLIQIGK